MLITGKERGKFFSDRRIRKIPEAMLARQILALLEAGHTLAFSYARFKLHSTLKDTHIFLRQIFIWSSERLLTLQQLVDLLKFTHRLLQLLKFV